MRTRRALAAVGLVAVLATAGCAGEAATSSSAAATAQSSATTGTDADSAAAPAAGAGGPGGVDVGSVTTEAALISMIQEAYGDASLGLHRGHQPVESVLNEVLTISHDELHVRMEEQGQTLAAVATDIGVDPQTLVDALVGSWSPAIDTLLANGTITDAEATGYREALEAAFTFRVNWDGQEATPTFSGLEA